MHRASRTGADLALVVSDSTTESKVVTRGIIMSTIPPVPLPKRPCTQQATIREYLRGQPHA